MELVKRNILILVLLTFVFALDISISRSVLPLTEGWWEYYAFLVNEGLKPYLDFELRLPPLYVYFISILIDFFDRDFLSMRIVMSALHLVSAWVTYLWLRKLVDVPSATFGVAVSVGLVMSNTVYLAKDYHTIVALFVIFVVYFTELNWELDSKYILSNLFFASFFSACLLLVKQNVGVLVFLSVLIRVFYDSDFKRRPLYCMFHVFFVLLVVVLVLLLFTYFIDANWMAAYSGNESKGGLFTVATRFITSKYCIVIELLAFLFVAASGFLLKYSSTPFFEKWRKTIYYSIFALFAFSLLASRYLDFFVLSITLAWLVVRFFVFRRIDDEIASKRKISQLFVMLAIAYAGTNTAGYNFVSLEVLVALFSAEFFFVLNSFGVLNRRYVNFLPLVFFLFSVSAKASSVGYNWWGYQSGGLGFGYDKQKAPFDEFDGITTDKQTVAMFRAIQQVANDLNGDSVFAYPSIPIVYLLLRQMPIGSPVLWFDVASGKDGLNTVSALNKHKPKYIFWLLPPNQVYFGHYKLRKADPAMLDVDGWLFESVMTGKYNIANSYLDFDGSDSCALTQMKYTSLQPHQGTCRGAVGGSVQNDQRFDSVDSSKATKINTCSLGKFLEKNNCIYQLDRHVLYVLKRVD